MRSDCPLWFQLRVFERQPGIPEDQFLSYVSRYAESGIILDVSTLIFHKAQFYL